VTCGIVVIVTGSSRDVWHCGYCCDR